MIKNYVIVGIRNLLKYKLYSSINIIGLAIGIAFFTVLVLLIQHELSYDVIHTERNRIYRVVEVLNRNGVGEESSSVPFPLSEAFSHFFPEYIASSVRIFNNQVPFHTLRYKKKNYNEEKLYFADSTFFQVFDYPLAKGNSKIALYNPYTLLISDRIAKKYFGKENPLGKKIIFQNQINFTVTGVFAPKKYNSHFDFDFIASFSTLHSILPQSTTESWIWNPCWTYVLLNENIKLKDLESKFPAFISKFFPESLAKSVKLYLQPLRQIHLNSNLDYEIKQNIDIHYIYIFSGIALMILIISAINYINLSMAHSSVRVHEIAIRKVLGADKNELLKQFFIESVITSLLATGIAFILIEQVLPMVENFSGEKLYTTHIDKKMLIGCTIGSGIIIGFISSLYPSYYLSRFDPLQVFNPSFSLERRNKYFRRGLIVVQFIITIFLLISTFVSIKQLRYISSKELGFDKKHVIIIPLSDIKIRLQIKEIERRLRKNNFIQSVALMQEVIGTQYQTYGFFLTPGDSTNPSILPSIFVSHEFLDVYQLKLLAGDNFNPHRKVQQIIINKKMLEYMNWGKPENAIGKIIRTQENQNKEVVGVVDNFNFESLHHPIDPFILMAYDRPELAYLAGKYLAIRVEKNVKQAIDYARKVWHDIDENRPFDYFYLSKKISIQYFKEYQLMKISNNLALVAIIIACLGMFCLSSFMVERRKKEIAIRKVMGINNLLLIWEIGKNFLLLVSIAILIALPISGLVIQYWLNTFSYRAEISISIFFLSSAISLLIVIFATGYHVVHAAVKNPSEDLQII